MGKHVAADLKNEYDLGYTRGRAEGQRKATEEIVRDIKACIFGGRDR